MYCKGAHLDMDCEACISFGPRVLQGHKDKLILKGLLPDQAGNLAHFKTEVSSTIKKPEKVMPQKEKEKERHKTKKREKKSEKMIEKTRKWSPEPLEDLWH